MDHSQEGLLDVAAMFKALGDPTRLQIFEFLRSCCCPVALEDSGDVRPVSGPTVGEVCCHITGAVQINSKISHHLKELRIAGLITIDRRGKNMICGVNYNAIAALTLFLREQPVRIPSQGEVTESLLLTKVGQEKTVVEELRHVTLRLVLLPWKAEPLERTPHPEAEVTS